MATLIGLLPLLPTLLTILGWILKWMGANEQVQADYKKLIESTKDSGLISVNMKDRLLKQKQEILDDKTP